MSTKILETSFKSYGSFYELVKRQGNVAMYSLKYEPDGNVIGYDVVIIRSYDPQILAKAKGKEYSGGFNLVEYYPSSNSFGSFGWSFDTFEKANDKFELQVMLE